MVIAAATRGAVVALTTLGSIWAVAHGVGCVSEVELDRTPCPCGEGFSCCETLMACLDADSYEASCPRAYPSSSASPCDRDADCARTEACHGWSIEGGEPAGPRQCRRRCEPAIACAAGERCEVAPHDGLPLGDFETLPLCLPGAAGPDAGPDDAGAADATDGAADSIAPDGCAPWSCQGCPVERLGRTFCQDEDLYGCLVSTDPICGVKCDKVLVKHCASCTETDGVVDCQEVGIVPVDPCEVLSCADCPANKATFCDGHEIATCLRAAIEDEACDELCLPSALTECATGCDDSSDEARCVP